MILFAEKILRKINLATKKYYKLYAAYWHSVFHVHRTTCDLSHVYLAPGINYGAGIAHQITYWYAGYALTEEFGLSYAHIPFGVNGGHTEDDDRVEVMHIGKFALYENSQKWDFILGLGEGEKKVNELKKNGYKIVQLPLFNFGDERMLNVFKKIVQSYAGGKYVLKLAIDQGFSRATVENRTLVLRDKFWSSRSRQNDNISYSKAKINIAVHIRRGDVTEQENSSRYFGNAYYVNAIKTVLEDIQDDLSQIAIYIFSEGEEKDFQEFANMPNAVLCLDWDAKKTFLHMVYADVIITGESGFSVYAASLSKAKRYACKDSFVAYSSLLEWCYLNKEGRKFEESRA